MQCGLCSSCALVERSRDRQRGEVVSRERKKGRKGGGIVRKEREVVSRPMKKERERESEREKREERKRQGDRFETEVVSLALSRRDIYKDKEREVASKEVVSTACAPEREVISRERKEKGRGIRRILSLRERGSERKHTLHGRLTTRKTHPNVLLYVSCYAITQTSVAL